MASQITGVSIAYSTVGSGADQRKHQSSASLAFVRGIPAQRASNAENVSIWWRHHMMEKIFHFLNINLLFLLTKTSKATTMIKLRAGLNNLHIFDIVKRDYICCWYVNFDEPNNFCPRQENSVAVSHLFSISCVIKMQMFAVLLTIRRTTPNKFWFSGSELHNCPILHMTNTKLFTDMVIVFHA